MRSGSGPVRLGVRESVRRWVGSNSGLQHICVCICVHICAHKHGHPYFYISECECV